MGLPWPWHHGLSCHKSSLLKMQVVIFAPELSRFIFAFNASSSPNRFRKQLLPRLTFSTFERAVTSALSPSTHLTVPQAPSLEISMIEIPPDVVAGWPTPYYANPNTKGPALPTIVLTFYILAVLALHIRLYDKLRTSRRLFCDDYLIIIAMVSPAFVLFNQLVCLLILWPRFPLRWSQLLFCCLNGDFYSTDTFGTYPHSISGRPKF
jgi:hypothetical protein